MINEIEIALSPNQLSDIESYRSAILAKLKFSSDHDFTYSVISRSIDARAKYTVYRIKVNVYTDELFQKIEYSPSLINITSQAEEIHIIGAGPAGYFAALKALELGFQPIIFEQGKTVKDRRRDLALLNRQGIINPKSNYCHGEGGAGTYSDGKLYTRSNKRGDVQDVLNRLVYFGADPDILINSRPHIGTNKLPAIIEFIRSFIIDKGGEIHFNSELTELNVFKNKIQSIIINGKDEHKIQNLILATGHSARNIYNLLNKKEILIQSKPFALGVRVEHPQEIINQAQYKRSASDPDLPPAYYSLVEQVDGRGVFSFCMCPGGIIAPCSTEDHEIVVNGWSPSKRNNPYANSGIVVEVNSSDYDPDNLNNPLAAMHFQAEIEKIAFNSGGGKMVAPAQRLIDYVANRYSNTLNKTSYLPGVQSVLINEILPNQISSRLRKAFSVFGTKLKGFDSSEAMIIGVESRTSSPVRIPRNPNTLKHVEINNLYPCGEGAGYAGGIVSAAIDGIRCSDAIFNTK